MSLVVSQRKFSDRKRLEETQRENVARIEQRLFRGHIAIHTRTNSLNYFGVFSILTI